MTGSQTLDRGAVIASVENVWKHYGDFAALQDVSLQLRCGEVHMLLGENGAGKSTLVNILIGATEPSKGTLSINGAVPLHYSPSEARRLGVNAVLQDFSLAAALSVADNYHLGREIIKRGLLSRREMARHVRFALDEVGLNVPIERLVSDLSRPEQQLLEIARAIGGTPGVLVLDEPTASLSHDESERLFAIVNRLKRDGWGLLYITHRMEEIRRLGDRVTVLRDGRQIITRDLGEITDDEMIRAMVGRPLQSFYPTITPKTGREALKLEHVSIADTFVRDVTLSVNYGEIVGIGGLLGSGKKEIGRVVFGLSRAAEGSISFDQADFSDVTPEVALRKGCVFLPQDRRGEALLLNRSIAENIQTELIDNPSFSLWGLLKARRLEVFTEELMARLNIRPRDKSLAVEALSGGNQQKVVLARAISVERSLYIFEEPTAGVDVGARMDFYNQLKKLCEAGAAILLITSDLQELINMSSRIYVMHAGRISAELKDDDRSEENVAAAAFGQPRGQISRVPHQEGR